MPILREKIKKYTLLPAIGEHSQLSGLEAEKDSGIGEEDEPTHYFNQKHAILGLVLVTLFLFAALFVETIVSPSFLKSIFTLKTSAKPISNCQEPKVRKEWRTLSSRQKREYISSVQCLQHVPSKLHTGMSLYDDFPFLHDVVGDYAHETAAFLTWHRYFIHLFEVELRDSCGYTGGLTYWDWSLDSNDLSQSPVFDPSSGFGGDSHPLSNPSEEPIVGGDRCLKDGPFSDVVVHWWTQQGNPHCLSRGFQDVVPISDIGHAFRPDAIEKLLQAADYEQFFLGMEHGSHNGIQVAIGGDIMFNTAPYDPIFYLHHTQLDRLWWQWQQIHPSHQWQYLGLAYNISDDRASLYDIVGMGDFAPGMRSLDLMSTESDLLCYRY